MSEDRPTGPIVTPPKRRTLPSVSDVVRELAKSSEAEPSILFKMAREVCAEELNRVKQGKESEPLDVLVRRARVRLDPSLAAPLRPPAPMPDPFEETHGALLKWDKEPREPLAEMMPGREPASPAPEELAHPEPPVAAEATERMEVPVPELPRTPSTAAPVAQGSGSLPHAPAGESAPETAWDDVAAVAHGEPAPRNRRGVLLALLALLAALGGFAAYTFLAKPAAELTAVRVRPGPPVARRPTPAVTPAAAASPVPKAAAPSVVTAIPKATAAAPRPKPAAAPPLPQADAQRQTRAAPLLSRDWAGKEPLFVLHFSSYKDRPSAEKDAAAVAKRIGKPARAVEVDLGDKGTWYRVVAGEFATAEQAFAFRSDLEAKGTPGMGFVYRLQPKP